MSAASAHGARRPRTRLVALGFALLVQATPALLLLAGWRPPAVTVALNPAIAVFDVPAPEAPPSEPLPEPEPQPERPAETPPAAQPAPATAAPVPAVAAPAAMTVPLPAVASPQTPAQPQAPAAPPPPPRGASTRPADWQARVLARLNAVKTYPASARARRQQGVVQIRFVIDRQGRVLEAALARTSGFALLDREATALPRRAQPLPAPPDEIVGARIELVVPVEFSF